MQEASDLVQGHGLLWCVWATRVRRRVAVVRIWSHEAAAAAAAVDAPTAISHLPKVSAFTVDLLFKRARSVYSGGLSDLGASRYFRARPLTHTNSGVQSSSVHEVLAFDQWP